MGENLAVEMGFTFTRVYSPDKAQTEALDTQKAALAMLNAQVDMILFAGGDGTARNIYQVIGEQIPVLGVPAGCKIHSGVYGVTPQGAGRVLQQVVSGQIVSVNTAQVMDIDEELFRQGKVKAKLYGEMRVPDELQYMQAVKMGGKESDELVLADIAAHIIELMDDNPEALFVMGSGSTVDFVMQELQINNTLLGVDIVQNQQLIEKDVTAEQLLARAQLATEQKQTCFLVITLIGGQGHILGRGNQQLSPDFIRQLSPQQIIIVATKTKLQQLDGRSLIVDSGDESLNQSLAGLITVTTGYKDQVLYPVM
jgi:predicted polyphosphate/ATP-dependent NAD kinase